MHFQYSEAVNGGDSNSSFLLSENELHYVNIPEELKGMLKPSAVGNNTDALAMSYPVIDERALIMVIIIYGCFFGIASVGNLTVFTSLCRPRRRRRKSRISLMILHLAIADLIVTFIMLPMEIFWRVTVQWIAGNVACKILLYLRAFGLYLSSNILICISLDRYFAIVHPLKVSNAWNRSKLMLGSAWGASFIYAIPQSIIFHTEVHPHFPNFTQCVSFGVFSQAQETVYNFMCLLCMYFLPLGVITVTYPAILWEIHKKSTEKQGRSASSSLIDHNRLRRSDDKVIERAKIRTLRMTIMIVVVFVVCWTPYVVMTLWYMLDRDSAERIPAWIREVLFMMVASNSLMNPIVYGSYAIDCSRFCLCCTKLSPRAHPRRHAADQVLNSCNSRNLSNKINSTPVRSCNLTHEHPKLSQQKFEANDRFISNHLLCIDYIPMMTFPAAATRTQSPTT